MDPLPSNSGMSSKGIQNQIGATNPNADTCHVHATIKDQTRATLDDVPLFVFLKGTTVLRFATTTPRIPVTVDTFETRTPEASPKVTTVLGFATTTPPIPVTVDTFEMRRHKTTPKVTRVLLRFATTTPPIPLTVDARRVQK